MTAKAKYDDLSMRMQAMCELVEDVADEYIYELCGCGTITEHEFGFEWREYVPQGIDSSYDVTAKQREWLNEGYEEMQKQMKEDLGLNSDDYERLDDLSGIDRDRVIDYELAWFEPAPVQFDVRVARGQVHVEWSVDYVGAPYYHCGTAEVIGRASIDIEDFMALSDDAMESVIHHVMKGNKDD